ncbi:hypothetical protein L596_002388 [Steinernema carpocapsae]|uniref:Transcription factor CBF/NF-Y/archaeal histone domain-containing protein n=1 Tax=Steinernema carpocapsae TaxID=34508 RepID=A0A4U8UP58_STECR|nr:hypothetical protein L596_002388 [Steinernema carpocapsae]
MSDSEDSGDYENRLPLNRVKRISHLIPEVQMMTSDSVQLITHATEKFIELMALQAFQRGGKRKTVQGKDIEACILSDPRLNFLEGALDGWPEASAAAKGRGERQQVKEDSQENAAEDEENPEMEVNEQHEEVTVETEEAEINENVENENVAIEVEKTQKEGRLQKYVSDDEYSLEAEDLDHEMEE